MTSANASLFDVVSNFITNPINTIVSVVNKYVFQPVSSAVSTVASVVAPPPAPKPFTVPDAPFFIGVAPDTPTTPYIGGVPASVPRSGWAQYPQGGSGSSSTGTYLSIRERVGERRVTTIQFSQIELTNAIVETSIANNELFSDMFGFIRFELANVGASEGKTKIRTSIKCRHVPKLGSKLTDYETEYLGDWVETPVMGGGGVYDFLVSWRVPTPKYDYGGDCIFTAELEDNVQKRTVVEQVVCTIWVYVTGTIEDCSTKKAEEAQILTEGKTEITVLKTILPRLPKVIGETTFNV